MTQRVLAFDAGMTMGWGAVGGNRKVTSGSRRLHGGPSQMGKTMVHAEEVIRSVIHDEKPDIVCFATPFVAMIQRPRFFKNGQWITPRVQPVAPEALRPLFGLIALIEKICEELGIRCQEAAEPEARRHFMIDVPKKSKDIKQAAIDGCEKRGWAVDSNHAADALVIATFIWECLHRGESHRTTPLFMQ